jgi:hypothetical protein
MADKLIYGCVESGTYSTSAPNPHVQLAGAASGFGIRQAFVDALADGETATVTIRATEDIWAVYSGAEFSSGSPDILDLTGATLLESSGTLVNDAAISVLALEPDSRQFPALFAPAIATNSLVLDLQGLRETYHRVTLDAAIDDGGITLANGPSSGVVRILVEFRQSGGPHTVPITAWSGIPGVVFDTPYQVYTDSTPTIVTLFSLDGGSSWRAGCNTEIGSSWDGDIADIDLDGGTDIGGALTDDDLILVDDGASGTNRKSALSRVWTWIQTKFGTGVATALGVNVGANGAFGVKIASGIAVMGTSSISSGASASAVTVAATGVATTDVITWGFNGTPNGVTGYNAASTTGGLVITAYPTANNVNFIVSNPTASSVTPGVLTLNWRVVR